jgi:hypothetical protein
MGVTTGTRQQSCLVSAWLAVAVGCSPSAGPGSNDAGADSKARDGAPLSGTDGAPGDAAVQAGRIEVDTQAALPTEVLTGNVIVVNGLVWDALRMTDVTASGIGQDGVAIATLSSTEISTDGAHTVGELARMLFAYLYSCAMPAGSILDLELGGEVFRFRGAVGLAAEWGEPGGTCDTECEGWISACVLARTNATGAMVEVSLRGQHPALQPSPEELAEFTLREGSFYGTIFDPTLQQTFACAGPGSSMPTLTNRFCSVLGDICPITGISDCVPYSAECGFCTSSVSASSACSLWDAGDLPTRCHEARSMLCDGNPSKAYDQVISAFLRPPQATCGDASCEGTEQETCPVDCGGAWVLPLGSICHDTIANPAVDSLDRIAIAGMFDGTIRIGDTVLTSDSSEDVFLAQISADGAPLWAQHFATRGLSRVHAVAVDANDNILLAASFGEPSEFGGPVLAPEYAPHRTRKDFAVVKYGPDGTHLWTRHLASNGLPTTAGGARIDLAAGAGGTVAVAVEHVGELTVDGTTFAQPKPHEPVTDILVVKLSSAGALLWGTALGGSALDLLGAVAVAPDGAITVVGLFDGQTKMGKTALSSSGAGDRDGFITHLSVDGAVLWAHRIGGSDGAGTLAEDAILDVAAGPDGSLAVAGAIVGNATVPGVAGPLPNSGGRDAFVARFSSAGDTLFATAVGTTGHDEAERVAWAGPDELWVAGGYRGSLTISSEVLPPFGSAQLPDLFVSAWNASGTSLRAVRLGGPVFEGIRGLAPVTDGLIVTAEFMGTIELAGTYVTGTGGTAGDISPGDVVVTRLPR